MKIYVSPHYRTAMWGSTISLLILEIMMLYASFIDMESFCHMLMNDFPWSILFLLFPVEILAFLFLLVWRLLIHTKIDEEGYQSYLGKRELCYINKEKQIYYAIFGYPLRKKTVGKGAYIAFSDEPFLAKEFLTPYKSFFEAYNVKKIIVLPYNEETIMYFETAKWNKLEWIYPEKKKKQKKL